MPEQTTLAEIMCEALEVIRDALDELPWAVTTDAKLGAEVLDCCGRLGPLLHMLANLDMPLANALGDVQSALAAIGEELHATDPLVDGAGADDDEEMPEAEARRAATRATATKLARWQVLINALFGFRQRSN
jgi:hypothetical protein